MFLNLRADLKRYTRETRFQSLIYVLFEQGLWAIAVYRFGRWAHQFRIPVIRLFFKIIAFILFKFIEITTGISLPASAAIGQGFYIGHFGNIILHSDVRMGENCSIGPGVVIGTRGLGSCGAPVLGDNVYVGVGAKILGNITIGNNVKVGANAVVIHDIPDGSTIVGIPARVVGRKRTGE